MSSTTASKHKNAANRKRSVDESVSRGDAEVPSPPKAVKLSSANRSSSGTGSTLPASTTDKGYKGLRHFSMMVCKKVEEKGTTTYNEVADELVKQVMEDRRKMQQQSGSATRRSSDTSDATSPATATTTPPSSSELDEKNIRRRVYDALNVLMAMDIIVKNKKEISWKGLPTSASQDMDVLQRELWYRQRAVVKKRETLQELIVQHVSLRNLVALNQSRGSKKPSRKDSNEAHETTKDNLIPLPFIVVNTSSQAVIQCHMSRDMTDVMFDFSKPFEINDDNTILKRLGLHRASSSIVRGMLPKELYSYCMKHNLLDPILMDDDTSASGASVAGDVASGANNFASTTVSMEDNLEVY